MSVLERVQFQELHRRDLMLQEDLKKVSNINSIFVTSISSCAFDPNIMVFKVMH